jgi:hypothetical protein
MRQVFQALAAGLVITVAARAQVFQETTPGLFAQTAKEQQFLAALASTPQLLTFEELAAGPVSSTQYAAFGVTLPTTLPAPPLAPGDCQPIVGTNNPNSSAHSGTRFIGPSSTSSAVAENFTINFAPPQSAVSLWIIDQEINQGAVDRIQVFGVGGLMLVNVSNLTNGYTGVELGAQGNMFFGFISATPIGSIRIIESLTDNDGIGFDDLRFLSAAAPTYPGTGDPLVLATSVGTAPLSVAPLDVKTASAGQLVTLAVSSSVYTGAPLIVALEPFVTGMPPSLPGLPSVHLSLANTILVVGGSTPFGPPVLPAPSFNFAFVAPAGFSGLSIMMQAAVLSPATVNGLFAASHAHEIIIL